MREVGCFMLEMTARTAALRPGRLARALVAFVPATSARRLAAFRIFLGLSCLWYLSATSPDALESVARAGPKFHANSSDFVAWLSASAAARGAIYWALIGGLAAFTAGIATRASFVVAVGALWLFVLTNNEGHFITPLLLALTATLPARWGDALSLGAKLRTGSFLGSPVRSRLYGAPIYICGLVIALAYTAAGLSKIILTHGEWLWDTGARLGFVEDLRLAAGTWALPLINSPTLALLASVFACLGQVGYIAACLTRSYRVKLAIGLLVGFPFLFGLAIFMGLYWWPWAILAVGLYLPWTAQFGRNRPPEPALDSDRPFLGWGQFWTAVMIAALVAGHAVAVAFRFEYAPILSNYPMYADPFRRGAHEADLRWAKWKENGLNYRLAVRYETASGAAIDVSDRYAWARIFTVITAIGTNWNWLSIRYFEDGDMLDGLNADRCGLARRQAAGFTVEGQPVATIGIGRRYYDFDASGDLVLAAPVDWIEINLGDCGARRG